MKNYIHNNISYKIANIIIWFIIFSILPIFIQILVYTALPFDYLVKINSYVTEDTNTQYINIKVNRIARFDIQATSLKQVYKIEGDGIVRVTEAPKRLYVYEKENNGKDVIIRQPLDIDEVGNYYIADTITLELPRGITKTKTIKSNSFLIYE